MRRINYSGITSVNALKYLLTELRFRSGTRLNTLLYAEPRHEVESLTFVL